MKKFAVACLALFLLFQLGGCEKAEKGGERGRDWDYTVVTTEDCPEDFLKEIETKKINEFQMSYDDGVYCYLAVGYGEQESGGFSIQVQGLYERGDSLCFETSLCGPEEEDVVSQKPSYPYIVIKTEKTDKTIEYL